MKKKISLKQAAISTFIGLTVTGTMFSVCTPLTFAEDNSSVSEDTSPANPTDDAFKISDIIFEPESASPGETVKVRALTNASRHQIFSVTLEMPVNDGRTEHVHLIHGENDVLEGSFTIGDNWANGEHKPLKVIVTDTAQNTRDYDTADTAVGSLNVYNSGEDFDAPVLKSVSYDKSELRLGEALSVKVDVTHASDIEELIITFADEENLTHSVAFEDGSTVHTADLSGWSEGTYRVVSVFIRDKAGNREYYEENDNLDEVELSTFSISNEYTDTQGPVVTRVTFDKANVTPDDTLTLIAEAHDSTGVSAISVEITAPDGEVQSYYLNQYEGSGGYEDIPEGAFVAQIPVDNTFLNGRYRVTHISATDTLGNKSGFIPGDDTIDLYVDTFTVSGSAADMEAPQIKKISLPKGSRFRPGENGEVEVILTDASDIWEAELCLYEQDSNEVFASFYGIRQSDNSYVFEFSIDNQWLNGKYDIRINTLDSLSNFASHNTGLRITVYDSPEDNEAPVINWVTADKEDLKPGDVVTLTADVSDVSDIDYVYAGLFLDGETMRDDIGEEILFRFSKGDDGLYRTHIEITHKFINGDYEVKLSTCDQWTHYEDDMDTDVVLSVSESLEHTDPPVVTSILFDKTDCVPGDTFTMTAVAEDDVDPVKYVRVYLAPSDGSYDERYNPHLYLTLYPDENGILSASEIVDNTWMNNTYEVMYVVAEDVLGNTAHYDNDLLTELYIAKELELNFLTVTGSSGKQSELHVSEILFDKEKVNIGETINITAKTVGEGAAKELILELADSGFEDQLVWNKKVYIYPDENGNLTGTLRIDPSDPFWRKDLSYGIKSVLVLDSDNDSRYYAEGIDAEIMDDLRDIEKNSFTVDTYAPPVIEPADYSAVDAALAEVPEDMSLYLQEGVDALVAAMEAVIRGKTELEQILVNSYAAGIRNALSNLELKPADYTELDDVIASIPEDLSVYTEESVLALQTALDKVDRELLIDKQGLVDGFTRDIKAAVSGLSKKEENKEDQKEEKEEEPEEKPVKRDEPKKDKPKKDKPVKKEEAPAKSNTSNVRKSIPAVKSTPLTETRTAPLVAVNKTAPQTGDNSGFSIWGTAAGISLAAIAGTVIFIRRRRKN